MSEEIRRLEDELKVSQSRLETMKGHRDSILEDYSVQSTTLTTMTDRAVIAECRLEETRNDLEVENETVAKLTRNYDLSKKTKEFMLDKLEGYAKCKADAERYKADAEHLLQNAERYKRGLQHFKRKARIAEEDCSANLFEFDGQKKALEEEVKALKAKIQAGCLCKGGEAKASKGEDKAGGPEDANIKKIKVLERKVEKLETDIENLKDSEETTRAAYEMEIKGDKATLRDLRAELDDAKDELDGYKEDNEERSHTIKGLLGLKKKQEKELADLKQKLALAEMAVKMASFKSGAEDGDGEASPSDPLSGADSSGAGQPGPSNLPSTSGTDQGPPNMSNFFGNSDIPPMDPNPQCPQS